MPNPNNNALELSTYQLQFIKVQEALLHIKQAYLLVNNPVQCGQYKKFLTGIEKNLQEIKTVLDSNEASTLLTTILSQWQAAIDKLNLEKTRLQSIGSITEHDRDILVSLTDTLIEGLKLPVIADNNNQINPALVLARLAMIRLAYEETLDEINKIKEELSPSCFLSYAWGGAHIKIVHQVADDLKRAGINTRLDIWHNLPGTSIINFAEEITKTDYVVVMGSEMLRKKYDAKYGNVVARELNMLAPRFKNEANLGTIKTAWIDGNVAEQAFPPYLNGLVFFDLRNEENYFSECLKLVKGLLEYSEKQDEITKLIESFEAKKAIILDDKLSQDRIDAFAKELEIRQQAKEKALLDELDHLLNNWRINNAPTVTPVQTMQSVGTFAVSQNQQSASQSTVQFQLK